MKNVLKIFIVLQTIFVFMTCINQLSQVLIDDGSINKYGAKILKFIDVDLVDESFFETFEAYGVLTGTVRGYSFFSPNLERFDRKFQFVSGDGTVLKPKTKYYESSFKYNCLHFSLFRELVNEDNQKATLRTMAAHLMSQHSLDCLDVFMDYNTYNDIKSAKVDNNTVYCTSDEIHLFTLRKRT